MELKKYAAGTLISQEGSAADGMYVVKSGQVEVYKMINGSRIVLSRIAANDFFGEMSLFLGTPRTASVDALTDAELLYLKKEDLLDQVQSQPELAVMMLTRLAKRLKEAHSIIGRLEGEKKALELIHR